MKVHSFTVVLCVVVLTALLSGKTAGKAVKELEEKSNAPERDEDVKELKVDGDESTCVYKGRYITVDVQNAAERFQ